VNSSPAGDEQPEESPMDQWGPWIALVAAIGLTASGEYELAQLVGFPDWIAWAFPVAVDVYVVQAIRRHRDVPAAIALMVATQALYHLGDFGLFGVAKTGPAGHETYTADWWLIVGVVAIAPLIVWRVHRIREDNDMPATEQAAGPVPVTDSAAPAEAPRLAPEMTAKTAATMPPEAPVLAAEATASSPTSGGDNSAAPGDSTGRQNEAPSGDSAPTKPAAKKTGRKRITGRAPSAPKAPRRSLTEWVEVASPIYHAEFARLRRQPTANEFATAIEAAGHGRVSDSTAKNIRTEILDRTELPALD
jgi:hypothetical protein